MTSMRVDGGASANLWAKRLGKLIDAIVDDGGQVFINAETSKVAVVKDGAWITSDGEDVTDER